MIYYWKSVVHVLTSLRLKLDVNRINFWHGRLDWIGKGKNKIAFSATVSKQFSPIELGRKTYLLNDFANQSLQTMVPSRLKPLKQRTIIIDEPNVAMTQVDQSNI